MIEVEVKLPLYRRSLTEKALVDLGFEAGDLIRESDLYFNSAFHDFIKADEALRVRNSENLTRRTFESTLNFKGKKMDPVSMTRPELETKVENGEAVVQILQALGYTSLFSVRKLRQLYHRDDVTACVDQVEGLGSFMELEIIVEDESLRVVALDRIRTILKALGSDISETTRRSYLSMLMKI